MPIFLPNHAIYDNCINVTDRRMPHDCHERVVVHRTDHVWTCGVEYHDIGQLAFRNRAGLLAHLDSSRTLNRTQVEDPLCRANEFSRYFLLGNQILVRFMPCQRQEETHLIDHVRGFCYVA